MKGNVVNVAKKGTTHGNVGALVRVKHQTAITNQLGRNDYMIV